MSKFHVITIFSVSYEIFDRFVKLRFKVADKAFLARSVVKVPNFQFRRLIWGPISVDPPK